ncbi:MAG: hypothetical protein ACJAVK_002612 [Akkermansiaceae bacterium]|jgi:hypothetical protein
MKLLPTFLFTVFAGGITLAAPPENHRPDRYKDLYLNSAITDAPPEEEPVPIINDLPDWVLVGVSKYVGRNEVEVMNINDRTRVRIPGKEATEMGFSIKEVQQGGNYIDDTVVTLKKGNNTGEVRFDPKFLVLKKVAGPSAATGRPSGNASTTNGRPPTSGKPPIPGARSGKSPGNRTTTPPRPGTKTSNVPRPTPATTPSTGATTKRRSRWIAPTK